ncbi:MAG: (d)CMP kinase, partial [Gammaproteobacteria bacterium]|nr:(d)CMP kinase [Gammaproteobacteria bacterium]
GRDIGTVVLPSALKIFLDASQEVRAKRRLNELLEKGRIENSSSAGQEIELRDELDSQRELSPLIAAPDAIKINTEKIGIAEVVLLINKAIDDA